MLFNPRFAGFSPSALRRSLLFCLYFVLAVPILFEMLPLAPAQADSAQIGPNLQDLSIAPLSFTGGNSVNGFVSITRAAPAEGVTLMISSSDAAVTVPASVLIPAGASSVAFAIVTSPVTAPHSVKITVFYAGSKSALMLRVFPPALYSIMLSTPTITGGTPTTGTVNMTGSAPAGGVTVFLFGSSAAVAVPATVAVPAGAASASFPITTNAVGMVTPVKISEAYGGLDAAATLTAIPAASLVSVSSPGTVRVHGGGYGFTDSVGELWIAETGAVAGGEVRQYSHPVKGVKTWDAPLYQTQRIGTSFTYTLAVPNGSYLLAVLFAELDPHVTQTGQRVCKVTVDGSAVMTVDAFADSGANVGTTHVVPVTVTHGYVAITFRGIGTFNTAAIAGFQMGLLPKGGGITPYILGASSPVPDQPAPPWAAGAIPMDGD